MAKRIHMCQSVRGALINWNPREWKNCVTENGKTLTPDEVRNRLFDELAKGHEVIPIGDACEGFDYSGSGCPGHEIKEDEPI